MARHPVVEHDAALLILLAQMKKLIGTPETYSGAFMAADGFGKPCPLRSKTVRRWNLSGAVSRAVDDIYEGKDGERLRKTMLEGYKFQQVEAERKLRSMERRATHAYGLLWGLCENAALHVAGRSMSAYVPLTHEEAMRVLDRATEVVDFLSGRRHVEDLEPMG